MILIGISEIDADAGAALVVDGRIVSAVNEERFSRIKQHRGFPHRSVEWVLAKNGLTLGQVDSFIIAKPPAKAELKLNEAPLTEMEWMNSGTPFHRNVLNYIGYHYYSKYRNRRLVWEMEKEVVRWVAEHQIPKEKIRRIPHHLAHAACAYYTFGVDPVLLITADGQGAGVSGGAFIGRDGKIERLHEVRWPHSMGLLYAAATKVLGFIPNRHEGKVTGLAAYALPPPEFMEDLRRLAYVTEEGYETPCTYGHYWWMKSALKRYGREIFASGFQAILEEVLTGFARNYLKKTGIKDVGLCGGVFANVKLNERIHELEESNRVFVFPHMADGGLCTGAAMEFESNRRGGLVPVRLEHVYLGPEYTEAEMESALSQHGIPYRRSDNPARETAQLIADKKVVARFDGPLEFGPRALGNRSILYHAGDPSVNDWLNKRLKRTEFMPFAPSTLMESATDLYRSVRGAEYTAQFMTITFDCTPRMRKEAPAAVHVDGTARPQLVTKEMNPGYYEVLRHYKEITGIPSVINTSYNMHEEPIVCSPSDACRAFLDSGIDRLAMGPFIATQPAR